MTSISMMLKVVRMPLLIPKFRQNLKHIACKEIASHTCRSVLFGFLDSVMKEMCSSGDHKLCFFVLIYASLTSNTLKCYYDQKNKFFVLSIFRKYKYILLTVQSFKSKFVREVRLF